MKDPWRFSPHAASLWLAAAVATLGFDVVVSAAEEVPFIGVIELFPGNVSSTHVAFDGLTIRLSHPETVDARPSAHSTAVASRLFPDNGEAKMPLTGGWASRSKWGIWSFQAGGPDAFRQALREMAPVTPVINHSTGFSASTHPDTVRARYVDEAVFRHRLFFAQVAHNQGPASGTLLDPAGAYNAVVVGASGPVEAPPDPDYFRGNADGSYLAYYSSRGPTTDGRYKPDLIAPGTFLELATYEMGKKDDEATFTWSGTSFAAPYVASAAAHLIELGSSQGHSTDPLVLKSVFQTTAQEVHRELLPRGLGLANLAWDGWTPSNTERPLDPSQGAGEISFPRAKELYLANPQQRAGGGVARMGWDLEQQLPAGDTFWYFFERPVHATATLTATLNWFREATDTGQLLSVDDLDLELWKTDGLEPLERVTLSNSRRDNVEHIHRFSVPETAFYALAVRFVEDRSGNGPNTYGLAWTLPESAYLPGDADLDGDVDLDDFALLTAGFGIGKRLSEGDFDLDRDVDLTDFSLLKIHFGWTISQMAVPEPAGFVLAWISVAWLLASRAVLLAQPGPPPGNA